MAEKRERLYLKYQDVDYVTDNGVEVKNNRYRDLDFIDNIQVSLPSVVTSYPVIEGDSISDHMYRQPGTINISGTFSETGRFQNTDGVQQNRLKNIQDIFENLKNKKIFIDIMSIYKIRKNYVLSNISWTEHGNSLDYTFTFNEIFTAKVTDVEYVTDPQDENLPDLSELKTLDFTDTLINKEELTKVIIDVLKELKFIDDEFLRRVGSSTALISIGAGIGGLAIAAMIALASTGAGILVLVVAAAAVAVGYGIYSIVKAFQRSHNNLKYKPFAITSNEKKNEAEYQRFVEFLKMLDKEIDVLENSIKVYEINENTKQETFLNIGGTYYSFLFEQNNTNKSWGLTVKEATAMSEKIVAVVPKLTGIASLSECTTENNLFNKIEAPQVYIFNKAAIEIAQEEYISPEVSGSPNKRYWELGKEAELTLAGRDLTNFMVVVSDIDLGEWATIIAEIIRNAVTA